MQRRLRQTPSFLNIGTETVPAITTHGARISTVRFAASDGDFPNHRAAVRACRTGSAHKIAKDRAGDHRCVLSGAYLELSGLSGLHSQPGRGGLAADVADANVRLGHGRGDGGDVDRKPALV